MKHCKRCGLDKPTSEFHKDAGNIDGLYSYCKPCALKKAKLYRAENLEKVLSSQKRSREKNPRVYKNKRLLYQFGITLEQYEQMLADQNGLCAICGNPETRIHPRSKQLWALSVDHDHNCCPGEKTCGKCLRGLLCCACNTALGLFRDNADTIKKAIQYLDNGKSRPNP